MGINRELVREAAGCHCHLNVKVVRVGHLGKFRQGLEGHNGILQKKIFASLIQVSFRNLYIFVKGTLTQR